MAPTFRAFVAIPLPDAAQSAIDDSCRKLTGLQAEPLFNITESEKRHLTLYFLGNVSQATLDACADRLANVRSKPFTLQIDGLVILPSLDVPRVLAGGISGDLSALKALQQRIQDSIFALDVFKEVRAFLPHITFARLKKGIPANAKPVKRCIKGMDVSRSPQFEVTSFQLLISEQGENHVYRLVGDFPLAND